MSSPDQPSKQDFDDARSEALVVVRSALQWELTDARWLKIQQVLDEMKAALESADAIALETAASEVALAGPVRVTRIGGTPPVPAPAPVRARVNHLMHELEGTRAHQDDSGQTGER